MEATPEAEAAAVMAQAPTRADTRVATAEMATVRDQAMTAVVQEDLVTATTIA